MNKQEEKLKELYQSGSRQGVLPSYSTQSQRVGLALGKSEEDFTDRPIVVNKDGRVKISPEDIDLIANLVVERLSEKLDRILRGNSLILGEEEEKKVDGTS